MNSVCFEQLLYNVMASIRTYCKHDVILVQKLLIMFNYLKTNGAENNNYNFLIDKEAQSLMDGVKSSMSNERDVEMVLNLAQNSGLVYIQINYAT